MTAWPGPRRIAHRGGGTLAPENTLAGVAEALARGYRGVEFDVMLTADGVPVLMHDAEFGRTIAGRGRVAETTWADLATRDAGAWFATRYAGERVPRYDEVVRYCIAHGLWMNVEIKPSPGRDSETGRIVAATSASLLEELGAGSDPGRALLLSSFSTVALDAARAGASSLPRGLLFGKLPANGVRVALALGCVSVHLRQRDLDRPAIGLAHDAGLGVMAYTIDGPQHVARLEAWGADALCIDRIDLIDPRAL